MAILLTNATVAITRGNAPGIYIPSVRVYIRTPNDQERLTRYYADVEYIMEYDPALTLPDGKPVFEGDILHWNRLRSWAPNLPLWQTRGVALGKPVYQEGVMGYAATTFKDEL